MTMNTHFRNSLRARSLIRPLLLWSAMLCCALPCAAHAADATAAKPAADAQAQTEAEAATPVAHLDLLPLGESSATPTAMNPAWLLLLALLVPGAAWAGCAWKRALDADPMRIRRRGIRDLRRLLGKLRRSSATPQPQHLHAWLRASARAWGVAASAPTARELSQATASVSGDVAVTSKWRELWATAERSLFAADAKPPQDWLEHASSAAAGIEVPPRQHRLPNRIGYWLPSTAATMLLTLAIAVASIAPGSAQADVEVAAVDEAQTAAIGALQHNWGDWAAHYNLAALHIRHERWNEAIAQATVAFLQNPSSGATRDNLRFALAQSQTVDPQLHNLLFGRWYQRVPVLFSAAGWQQLAIVAGLSLAAGMTALVFALYAARRKLPMRIAGGSAVAIGALLLGTSIASWNAYGALHQASACILVQHVNLSPAPTDLVPTEETSPAAAGSIVQMQRSFLGWSQVAVDADHSGWVRRNAVIPVYARRQ
jgi:hypothetical protein